MTSSSVSPHKAGSKTRVQGWSYPSVSPHKAAGPGFRDERTADQGQGALLPALAMKQGAVSHNHRQLLEAGQQELVAPY